MADLMLNESGGKNLMVERDSEAFETIARLASKAGIDIKGAKVRRTSSRFCLGVEHGDYNGVELFGVGTDRFIWMAYRANNVGRIRIFSGNFPDEGTVDFTIGKTPTPLSDEAAHIWARFPYGVDYILRREGLKLKRGMDAVLYGNIPGGGMSRSASLSINLILSLLDLNNIEISDRMKIVDMAQAVENEYIGAPCGNLDQIMILFAKAGRGVHYIPKTNTINYVPLGESAKEFRIVCMDTGTVRPGLEKSTYKTRRAECDELTALAKDDFNISCLGDVKDDQLYARIIERFSQSKPNLCKRLNYIFFAQKRFKEMLSAWKIGDIEKVGKIFRTDGVGLRDDYEISGPELETMCDIARTAPGVLGERMLGGGDKGAAGALVLKDSVDLLKKSVDTAYPRSRPEYSDRYAVHVCKAVDGVVVFDDPGL